MEKFIKGRWFPLLVAILIVAVVAFFMAKFGWRIIYATELENNWEAISAVAAWAGVIASFGAIMVAIWIPKRIADQQNKIALFEKRYAVYELYNQCKAFSLLLERAQSSDRVVRFFYDAFIGKKRGLTMKEWSEVGSIYADVCQGLSEGTFLFDSKVGNHMQKVSDTISDILFACIAASGNTSWKESSIELSHLLTDTTYREISDSIKRDLNLI